MTKDDLKVIEARAKAKPASLLDAVSAKSDVLILLAEVRRLRVSEAVLKAQAMTDKSAAWLYQHASETGAAIASLSSALNKIYSALDGAEDARDACIEIAEVVAAALGKPSPLK